MKNKPYACIMALAFLAGQALAQQTTAFTYQGQLREGGTNANGTYTMIFSLYDAATSGSQIGGALTNTPTVANGLFSANLDFGASAFNGGARWLDINVEGEPLTPRAQVLPLPYALFATVAGTVASGAVSSAQLADNAVGTANIQDGAVTDAKIISLGGAKVSGAVPLAEDLAGALAGDKLSGTYSNAVNFDNFLFNSFSGSFFGDGGGLTNLSAVVVTTTNIQDGAVTDAKISIQTTLTRTLVETNLVIVRGTLNSAGAVVAGQGFSVSITSSTERTINFDTPFSSYPTIALGQHGSSGNAIVDLVSSSPSGFSTIANGSSGYDFIAIGPK